MIRPRSLAAALALLAASPASAYLASNARIEGKLIRFDRNKLVMEDKGRRFEVPRDWIPESYNLVANQPLVIEVLLSEEIPEELRPPECADVKILSTDPKWTQVEFEGEKIRLATSSLPAGTRAEKGEVVEVPFAIVHVGPRRR
jgi:hypothetical protein